VLQRPDQILEWLVLAPAVDAEVDFAGEDFAALQFVCQADQTGILQIDVPVSAMECAAAIL